MASDTRDSLVSELMTRRTVGLRATDTVAHAHQVMLWSAMRHLPVLDAERRVVGVVSDRDLLPFAGAEPSRRTTPVSEVMTRPVETITGSHTVSEAAARMAAKKIDCLPVLDGGRLVGMLTSMDVLAERGKLVHRGAARHIPVVADVMRTRAVFVSPDAPLIDAVSILARSDIRHLPVVDANRRVVGMISDRDVRARVGDPISALVEDTGDMSRVLVEAVMTPDPVQVRPTSSILECADALIDERVGALPVEDAEDRLVGIVSYVDVLAYLVGRDR